MPGVRDDIVVNGDLGMEYKEIDVFVCMSALEGGDVI
jgi:hypothetical protein